MLQHAVPKEVLTQIGDVTVSFSLLELSLQCLTGSFIAEHQRVVQIVTAELSFSRLRALAKSLYTERHGQDEDYVVLQSLMHRAKAIEDKRNKITHSFWGASRVADTVTGGKITAKERTGLRVHFETYDAEKIKSLAGEIKKLAAEVMDFQMTLIQKRKAINNPFKALW